MAYQAEISRKNPGCFLFLVDQSESMEDPFAGGDNGKKKAEELATILNKLIHNLSIRCAKSDSIYDYFHVGVLGYSDDSCKPALGGELSGRALVPISELASKPLRIEERTKQSDDGAGGVMDQTVKFPVWFDAYAKGGTPMCAALKDATKIVEQWCQEHPQGFPPIVINITDGEATDGDLVAAARNLTAVSGEDGEVLLFNIHLSSTAGPSIELPCNAAKLPDQHAKALFEASSTLTPFMVARAKELGLPAADDSRGFIFNAQPLHVIHFLDIGTRPANVRLR
ncbi:MAG TPA: vWA domain-containing protein [Gemmatimonadales bacterium]|nr:vWA domain-containing protein [Gemmatimonadales bacterium]